VRAVAPVAPATASVSGSNTVVAFPITGGHVSLLVKSVQGTPWIQIADTCAMVLYEAA
jgi:hypothetical protein